MKRSWFAPLLITLLAIAPAGAREAEEAIKDWSEQFVAAWNRDDAKALANLWTEDGDLINPFGRHANGRAQIEQLLESEHTAQMKSTVYKITSTSVRLLKSDVAVLDWDCMVTGIKGADAKEMPPFKHHVTWVLLKRAGEWLATTARPAAPLAAQGEAGDAGAIKQPGSPVP